MIAHIEESGDDLRPLWPDLACQHRETQADDARQ
jgi:hypothetical protein